MGETKAEREARKASPSDKDAAAGLGLDKGYIGTSPDPIPNEAYSQESDPTESPSAVESREALAAGKAPASVSD